MKNGKIRPIAILIVIVVVVLNFKYAERKILAALRLLNKSTVGPPIYAEIKVRLAFILLAKIKDFIFIYVVILYAEFCKGRANLYKCKQEETDNINLFFFYNASTCSCSQVFSSKCKLIQNANMFEKYEDCKTNCPEDNCRNWAAFTNHT